MITYQYKLLQYHFWFNCHACTSWKSNCNVNCKCVTVGTSYCMLWQLYMVEWLISVWFMVVLQPLRWCCIDCVIHHERDVREEQKCICVVQTSNNRVIPMKWSWWVTANNACEPGEQLIVLVNSDDKSALVRWSLLLLAATVRSFVHMPLRISDRNSCNSGYNKKHQQVLGHSYLFKKPDLWTKWMKFDNQSKWKPIKNSIVCIKHFNTLRARVRYIRTLILAQNQQLSVALPMP